MKTLKLKTSFIVALLICSFVFGQTQDQIRQITADYNHTELKVLSNQFHNEHMIKIAYAREFALKNNIPIFIEEDGRFASLQRIMPDGTPIYYTTFNINAAKSTRTNYLHSGGALGLNLSGQNLRVHIWDGGLALATHQEFGGRYTAAPNQQSLPDDNHAAHVTGTVMASGVVSNAKGMAPESLVIGYDWNDDKSEAAAAAQNGMLISNHSYGYVFTNLPTWYFGAYIDESRDWDQIMYSAPYYLMVVAAGNDGTRVNANPMEGISGYDKLSGHSVSKNNLVVANAVDASIDNNGNLTDVSIWQTSSQGPTDDYRIKPDITGNGYSVYSTLASSNDAYGNYTGTSMASPNVAGTLLLLQEYYDALHGNFMRAATLKGLTLHTADNTQSSFGDGPNAIWGWGLMNAKRAAETIKNAADEEGVIIQELALSQGQTYQFTVESDGTNDLIASISWTDPAGTSVYGVLNSTTPVLVNDLDIRITQEGDTFYPWKLTGVTTNGKGDNIVDPFERIDVPAASGSYTITISHKGTLSGGSQNYSLIVTGITDSDSCPAAVISVDDITNCGEGEVNLWVEGNNNTTELRLYASEVGDSFLDAVSEKEGMLTTPYTESTTTYYVAASNGECESPRIPVEVIITGENIDFEIKHTEFPNEGDICDYDYTELSIEGLSEPGNTEILFDENFGPLAYGWTSSSGGSGVGVGIDNTNYAGGTAPELVFSSNQINNDFGKWSVFPNTGDVNASLPIDISFYTDLEISFKYALQGYQPNNYSANILLEVSTDGNSFIEFWSNENILTDIPATTLNLDLSDYIGNDELYFKLSYSGDSFGLFKLWVDDIKITGKKMDYQVTWSPTDGLYKDTDLTEPYLGGHADVVYASSSESRKTFSAIITNGSCTNSKTVMVGSDINIFIADDGDWSEAGNWSMTEVPNLSQCVRVPNAKNLTIDTEFAESKTVIIEDGGQITIGAGAVLTVSDKIKNNSSTASSFAIEEGGILLQTNPNAVNSGDILVKKIFNFSDSRQQYNFVTSPVMGQSIKSIYPGAQYVIDYHEDDNYFYDAGNGEYDITNPAKGYAIKEATGSGIIEETGEFTGVPFNGNAEFILSRSDGNDYGYNLIGNPYPSNIDIRALYNANNTVIGNEFWFWDNRGNTQQEQQGSDYQGVSYAKYNADNDTGSAASGALGELRIPTKYVNTGTAFMIRASENADNKILKFTNDIRTAESGINLFGKDITVEKDRYWLTMTAPTGITTMAAVVYFENGSDDYGLDDTDYSGASDEIYTIADGHRLTIQGRAPFRKYDVVQMGLNGYATGVYTFSLYDYEGVFANGQHIYVRDKKLNIIHDLTEGDFSVRLRAGQYDDRFELIYRKLNFTFEVASYILILKQDNEIVITSNKDDIKEVNLYNMLGLPVYQNTKVKGKELRIPAGILGKQVLVAYVKTENGEVTVRKVINK